MPTDTCRRSLWSFAADDVAKILVPALNTNEALREFLAGRKLRQQYWYRHVADLILDRQWETLHE